MQVLRPGDPAGVGPYRLLRRLGVGATGRVFLGRDADGWLAAVKVLHDGYAADAAARARFAREVAVARSVQAPWAPAVLDADPQAPVPWLATEYVFGPTAESVLESAAAMPEQTVGVLGLRLARALAELHERDLVHRNLAPSNVLLGTDGPKLVDFGEAGAPGPADTSRAAPGWMSPEQLTGAPAGPASDVFSLATLLVRAATGSGPFGRTARPLAMLRRVVCDEPDLTGVPEPLRRILTPCLAKQPQQRPTAVELTDSLAGYADVPWPPPVISEAIRREIEAIRPRWVTRRTALVGLGIGIAALAAGAIRMRSDGPSAEVRWTFGSAGEVGHVAYHDGALYAAGRDGTVHALDAATGRPRWAYHARAAHDPMLVVVGGALFLTDDAGLSALDTATGRLLWQTPAAGVVGASAGIPVGYLERYGRTIVGFDPASGAVRWRYRAPDGEYGQAPLTGAEGRLHVAFESALVTLDGTTGTVLWRHDWPKAGRGWLAAAAGRVYAPRYEVEAVDAASGRLLWHQPVPIRTGAVAVAGDHRLYLTEPGRRSALDATTGAPVWLSKIPNVDPALDFIPTATLLDDTLYLGSARSGWTGTELIVSAYAADSGQERWTLRLDGLDGTNDRFSNLVAAEHGVLRNPQRTGLRHQPGTTTPITE